MRCQFRIWMTLAVVLSGAGLLEGQKKPTGPDLWPEIDRAAGLIGEEKYVEAAEVARKIITTDASHPMGYALQIHAAEKRGDNPAVIRTCDALLSAFPLGEKEKRAYNRKLAWHAHAQRHKGEAWFRMKEHAKAAGCFSRASKDLRDMRYGQLTPWGIRLASREAGRRRRLRSDGNSSRATIGRTSTTSSGTIPASA